MPQFNSQINLILDLTNPKSTIRSQLINHKYGIYYWFIKSDSINKLINPITSLNNIYSINNNGVEYYLIYIGLGPRDSLSNQFFNQRILDCHLGNKISNSTFRYSIASSLYLIGEKRQIGINLKYFLTLNDEELVTKFIKENFILAVKEHNTPWDIESYEIKKYQPPFNITDNNNGWYLKQIKLLRKLFRDCST